MRQMEVRMFFRQAKRILGAAAAIIGIIGGVALGQPALAEIVTVDDGPFATMLNLPEGGGTTTIESKTNFLGPALNGATVVAECTPIHRGKRTMVWQTRISTKEGRLVAIVTQTQLIL